MKNKRRKKRMTMPRLLLRGLLAAAIICAAFAGAFREYILYQIRTQTENQLNEKLVNIQQNIGYIESTRDEQFALRDMSYKIGIYTNFDIYIRQPISLYNESDAVQVTPYYSRNNHAVCALVDEDNNIAASNRQIIFTLVKFGEEDSDNGLYLCDNKALDIPQLDELFADIEELYGRCGDTGDILITIDSIYYDRSNKMFIPRTGRLTLERAKSHRDLIYDSSELTVEEEREINIDLDGMGYETMERTGSITYPRFSLTMPMGVPESEFEQYGSDFEYCINEKGVIDRSFYRDKIDENQHEVTRTLPVYIGGKSYQLFMRFIVDERDPQFVQFYYKWVIIFSAVTLAITLLLCWRKNVMNKAQYRFEDYQRELTDHLAHDIKTPLMAIGGYAENILDGRLTPVEETRYLNSILENVSFTDSIVNRTLLLNNMESLGKTDKERFPAESVFESAVRKYMSLLDEKNISYSCTGSAEINAIRESFETLTENLISNAVKYTPEGGSITVTLGKKRIVITNTAEEDIPTKDLTRPFVRGDAARSNTKGSGLGLSIAERACDACGFTLAISCENKIFRAEIRL